jgi:ferredoxin
MYPLLLLDLTPDAAAESFFQMKGQWRLLGVEDTSHTFLYAHHWWGAAKKALQSALPPLDGSLEAALREVAQRVEAPVEHRITLAAVVLMTYRQCGEGFLARPVPVTPPRESAESVLSRRTPGRKGGWLSSLLGRAPEFRVCFDEAKAEASFPILASQEITTAAELDKRPYHLQDARCYEGMGPIPVDCRSGSCGTCWVGVLGGRENLEALGEFERKRMEYFGYWDAGFAEEAMEHPRIRLACQAKAFGPVSLVIPPWNGVFGVTRRTKERKS